MYLGNLIEKYDKVIFIEDSLGKRYRIKDMAIPLNVKIVLFSELDRGVLGDVLELTSLYEFSDNVILLKEDQPSVASVFNFVKSGVLTMEEAWLALLH